MVFYGDRQDLIYYALRHTLNGRVDTVIIKNSGEFLINESLGDSVSIVMLNNLNMDDVLTTIANDDTEHINEVMSMNEIMKNAYIDIFNML